MKIVRTDFVYLGSTQFNVLLFAFYKDPIYETVEQGLVLVFHGYEDLNIYHVRRIQR